MMDQVARLLGYDKILKRLDFERMLKIAKILFCKINLMATENMPAYLNI